MGALNLPTIASGQLQPYQTSNDADAAVESAVTAELSVDLTSGDHTLTQSEFTRSIYFASTGNSVSRTLTTPATNRLFVVHNGGSSALTLKTGSTTLSISSSDTGIFYTDGTTDGLLAIVASTGATGAAGGDLTGTFPNPTIGAGKVSLAKMANLAADSIVGNNTGSAATPIALTVAQVKTLLALAVADISGAAPLASPTFTGTPAAPTAAPGTNTSQLSTTAFVQAAIAALTGGLIYKGTWNANTNSPTITSGSGTLGWFYKVSTAGTTTVDGISSWDVNDMLLFDGAAWDKIDGQDTEVISVAGRTGVVTLTTSDVGGIAAVASSGSASDLGTGTLPDARLSNTAVTAGSYGDGTHVGTFTVDAHGRLTAASNTTITGAAPTGAAGGDLAGTFPNPTIAAAAVTLAKQANLAANSIQGNNTGSPATPLALTAAQVKTLLAIAAGDVSGLAAIATSGSASDLSSGTVPSARLPTQRYDIATFYPGVPGNSQLVLRWQAPRAVTIPSGGTNSQASAGTAATGSTTFTVKQNGSSVGTIVWSSSGTSGAFTISSTINLAAGDVLTITGPSTADATLADISITLAATA